jgi:hypothetical protein
MLHLNTGFGQDNGFGEYMDNEWTSGLICNCAASISPVPYHSVYINYGNWQLALAALILTFADAHTDSTVLHGIILITCYDMVSKFLSRLQNCTDYLKANTFNNIQSVFCSQLHLHLGSAKYMIRQTDSSHNLCPVHSQYA